MADPHTDDNAAADPDADQITAYDAPGMLRMLGHRLRKLTMHSIVTCACFWKQCPGFNTGRSAFETVAQEVAGSISTQDS